MSTTTVQGGSKTKLKKLLWSYYTSEDYDDSVSFSEIANKSRDVHGNYVSVMMLRLVCEYLDYGGSQ